ncbi:universal stress protein, partial [Haladaptatus sp.]|uniref:universal stress protein n=1 Tax=Haladaptatus sp. TaxID=1973141 RepID=UPI003C6799D3
MIFDPTAEHDPLETADSLVTDGGTTEESIEIEFVMEEDEDVHDGNRILVPILDTQTDDEQEYDIKRLLGTASSLARSRDGVVHLVNILLFPAQTPLDTVARDSQIDKERKKARDDVTELLNWAEDNGFRDLMQGSVCLAHKEARTLHQLVDGGEYDAVFLGTRKQTSQRQRLLRGDTIERFLETATCDVYVERFGLEPYVEELGSSAEQAHRLLLAVADSVHSDLA